MRTQKLAVIGASHFQLPLIQTAQRMGCEVHAFAWECGDVGEREADVFHPVSITETDAIVDECRRVGVDGVCTIASDLATVAVTRVADALGLTANPVACMRVSTDKRLMRRAFAQAGDPSPRSVAVRLAGAGGSASDDAVTYDPSWPTSFDPTALGLTYPLIVKPSDRSGSRGVTKLETPGVPMTVGAALEEAFAQGFQKCAMVEEFAQGDEFSVEGMSWEGAHHILAITRKATTGAPHFIETGHIQPAGLAPEVADRVRQVTSHALTTLGVRYGASHTELKIDAAGEIRIIEIGARMGGDCIGSHLVELSTGIDYVRAVVDVALGREPDLAPSHEPTAAAVRFLFDDKDVALLDRLRHERPELVRHVQLTPQEEGQEVVDSSTRRGYFVMSAADRAELLPYLPRELRGDGGASS